MDAKPQRPRVLRIHDENVPIAVGGPAVGKTLHQRTKSTPAFSTLLQTGAIKGTAAAAATAALTHNKRVLGEINANIRVSHTSKDDSEVGKASPGKIAIPEIVESIVTAPLARPATRPLGTKSSFQPVPTNIKPSSTTHAALAGPEPVKKVVPKKSTKVLKEVDVIETAANTAVPAVPALPSLSTLPAMPALPALPLLPTSTAPLKPAETIDEVPRPVVEPTQLQEIHKTESIPLRDEAGPRAVARTASMGTAPVESTYAAPDEYRAFMEYAQGGVASVNGNQAYAAPGHPQQYFDAEETQYDYDDGYTTGRSFTIPGDNTGTMVLLPVYTDKVRKELQEAKDFVDATRSPDDIEDEAWDTSMVAEYGDDIFEYMREKELIMSPNPHYMDQQTEIQWTMRAVLMDWVVQVHQRFNLLPETLFLTVNYIDRFLSCKVVSLGKLQLVGATAIFIAAKYEEVQCPTISEIIYMVDGGYSAEELLKAERFMLSMLQFELGWPGPMSFLRRISKADDYDLETRTLAKYFLEITIMDERFVSCPPSFLAAGAHCMARLMIYGAGWSQAHAHYSNYTFHQLKTLLKAIWEACLDPRKHHNAVYEKYTDKRYKRASTFVEGKMADGFRLPFDGSGPDTRNLSYGDGFFR